MTRASGSRIPAALILCLVLLPAWAFLAGLVVAHFRVQPYPFLLQNYLLAKRLIRGPEVFDLTILHDRRYAEDGVVTRDAARMQPGLTLVAGVFTDGPAIRIYDAAGTVRHAFPLDFFAIWPDPRHIVPERERPQSLFGYHNQGLDVQPDGGVIINFSEKGLARLDGCGRLLWKLDRMTHHAVTRAPDGTYWVPAKGEVDKVDRALYLPGVTPEKLLASQGLYADRLLHIDADGRILQEIDLLRALFGLAAATGRPELLARTNERLPDDPLDPTHLNDIEPVTEALAARIPGTKPGDLLLSLRNLDMLAILDPATGRIEWTRQGPWIGQHDPDITPEGLIEVFDNGVDIPLPGRERTGSRILAHDPATDSTRTLLPAPDQPDFFTDIMGVHERLANGNILVTEATAGRIFETTAAGEPVWDLRIPARGDAMALLDHATRLPGGFDPWAGLTCPTSP